MFYFGGQRERGRESKRFPNASISWAWVRLTLEARSLSPRFPHLHALPPMGCTCRKLESGARAKGQT